MGNDREDFVTLTHRITRLTGGIVPQTLAAGVTGGETGAVWLFLRGKAVAERAGDLIHILRDVLLSARLDDGRRLQQMILEEKARLEHELVPMGHQMVSLRLRSVFSEALWGGRADGWTQPVVLPAGAGRRSSGQRPGNRAGSGGNPGTVGHPRGNDPEPYRRGTR